MHRASQTVPAAPSAVSRLLADKWLLWEETGEKYCFPRSLGIGAGGLAIMWWLLTLLWIMEIGYTYVCRRGPIPQHVFCGSTERAPCLSGPLVDPHILSLCPRQGISLGCCQGLGHYWAIGRVVRGCFFSTSLKCRTRSKKPSKT